MDGIEIVFELIRQERERQEQLCEERGWPRIHTQAEWLVIHQEEIGEMCEAVLKGDRGAYRKELIQAIAVLVAAYEQELRFGNPVSPEIEGS